MSLYPLRFHPIYKPTIWGGEQLKKVLHKDYGSLPNCGESWEISAIPDYLSVVSNGYLEGNSLVELVEVYMSDLLGNHVYKKYGLDFPLLIKFIATRKDLSIQVHPDDVMAFKEHAQYGKTEMWYVLEAPEGTDLICGFKEEISESSYVEHVQKNSLIDVLNVEKIGAGDVFFIPPGRVHAIKADTLLVEIQQSSDLTYRIYDYDRKDDNGNKRELHTALAKKAIDYTVPPSYKTTYEKHLNKQNTVVSCPHFTTALLRVTQPLERDYHRLDSFVIYIGLRGSLKITGEGFESEVLKMGETILVPAQIERLEVSPVQEQAEYLEVFIEADDTEAKE